MFSATPHRTISQVTILFIKQKNRPPCMEQHCRNHPTTNAPINPLWSDIPAPYSNFGNLTLGIKNWLMSTLTKSSCFKSGEVPPPIEAPPFFDPYLLGFWKPLAISRPKMVWFSFCKNPLPLECGNVLSLIGVSPPLSRSYVIKTQHNITPC